MKKLFLSIIIVISVIIAAILFSYIADDGLKQDVYDILLFIWNRFVYPIFWFINDKFSLIVSWPIAILILLYLVFKNRLVERALYPVMHRVRAVDLFGVSVELSEQINDIQRESDDLLKRIPRFQSSLASEMQKLVLDMKIDTTFCSMVLSICDHIAGIKSGFKRENCRATVHVEGFLFSGQLIQLVEYVSGDGRVYAGKSAGRTFSVRRGIIGRVWRSQLPEIKGVLETGFDINSDEATRQIAQMWGLTRPEAVHVKKYPSYMAIPINYANDKIAVFYMDSTDEDAFPLEEEQEFCGFINKTFRKNGLLSAISQLDARLSVPNKIDPLEVIENG